MVGAAANWSFRGTFGGACGDIDFDATPFTTGKVAVNVDVEAITSAIARLAAALHAEIEARVGLETRVESLSRMRSDAAGCPAQDQGQHVFVASCVSSPFDIRKNDSDAAAVSSLTVQNLRRHMESLDQELSHYKRQQDQKARATDELFRLKLDSMKRDLEQRADAAMSKVNRCIEEQSRAAACAAVAQDFSRLHDGLHTISTALGDRQSSLEEQLDTLGARVNKLSFEEKAMRSRPETPATSVGASALDDVDGQDGFTSSGQGSNAASVASCAPFRGDLSAWISEFGSLRAEVAELAAKVRRKDETSSGGAATSETNIDGRIADVVVAAPIDADQLPSGQLRRETTLQSAFDGIARCSEEDQDGDDSREGRGGRDMQRLLDEFEILRQEVASFLASWKSKDRALDDTMVDAGSGGSSSQPAASEGSGLDDRSRRREVGSDDDRSRRREFGSDDMVDGRAQFSTFSERLRLLEEKVGDTPHKSHKRLESRVSSLECAQAEMGQRLCWSASGFSGANGRADVNADLQLVKDRLAALERAEAGARAKYHGDAASELPKLLTAIRGVQRDAAITSSKLEDVTVGLNDVRLKVDALPLYFRGLDGGTAAKNNDEAETMLEGQDGSVAIPNDLGALYDLFTKGNALRHFATREDLASLQRSLEAFDGEAQQQFGNLRGELLDMLDSKANRDDLRGLQAMQRAMNREMISAQQNLDRSYVDDAAVTRQQLMPSRCISCDQRVEIRAGRPHPCHGAEPIWAKRESSCPVHKEFGAPPGYRQRRAPSAPNLPPL